MEDLLNNRGECGEGAYSIPSDEGGFPQEVEKNEKWNNIHKILSSWRTYTI